MSMLKVTLSSLQWLLFILIGSIVTPLSIGFAFGLPQEEIALLLQRTFLVIGISSILQSLFGHKLPILEGTAGLWWGVFLLYGGMMSTGNENPFVILQELEMALLCSGLLFILLGIFKAIDRVKELFTPLVIGTYIILLVFQLSQAIIKGILGIGYMDQNVDFNVAMIAIVTIVICVFLAKSKITFLRTYSILFGLLCGWGLFVLFGLTIPSKISYVTLVSFPDLFHWGWPKFSGDMILTSVVTTLLLTTNLVASIKVVEMAVEKKPTKSYNKAGMITGINQVIAGIFASIGCISNSHTAGFIKTTHLRSRVPFIIGSSLIIIISFIPILSLFFSTIPSPIGYAVVFFPFVQLLSAGLREVKDSFTEDNKLMILCIALMSGIGSMAVPTAALELIPTFLLPLFNNGLVVGVLTAIILEQISKLKRYQSQDRIVDK